jgi:SagB-type dehydrogenase family enzyme
LFDDFHIVQFFHENSKRNIYYRYSDPDFNSKPLSFKEYNECSRITLPKDDLKRSIPVEDAIVNRRSCRKFDDKPLSLNIISKILKFGYGVVDVIDFDGAETFARASPSAGALYPYEIYLAVFNIDKLEKGIYHYCPFDHSLELLKTGDFIKDIALAFMSQYFICNSSVCIILSGVIERTLWKYGARGYRFMLLEAGHVVQNMCLISESENLGTLPLGGFYDNVIANLLEIDSVHEPVIYGLVIGHEMQ